MIFVLRTPAWVPGGLGGRSRRAWVASSGPLGCLLGSSRGSRTQTTRQNFRHFHSSTLRIRIKIDVDFWSFWGRSWVPLGGHFRSSWRFLALKWLPEPSSNPLIFEKVNLHEILRFPTLWGSPGSHMAPPKRPRSLQDGSLILLGRFFFASRFSLRFWIVFGSVLGRFGAPKWSPKGDGKRGE